MIESAYKLIPKIQPVVTQVLRSPKIKSAQINIVHTTTKNTLRLNTHTHTDIHTTTTPCSFLPVPRSTKNNH